MCGAVFEWSDSCYFGAVSTRRRLEVGRCIAPQITDDAFIDVQIVIRLAGAGIYPGKGDLHRRVAVGAGVTGGKGHREIKSVARKSSPVPARIGIQVAKTERSLSWQNK